MTALLAAVLLAGLPKQGVLVPGTSLAGLRLGATPAQVRGTLGGHFGRCQDCTQPTWYYNYAPFEPQGFAVSFRGGRVNSLYTIWSPAGWRTREGLLIGADAPQLTTTYGRLMHVPCGAYSAYLKRTTTATTEIYVFEERVWGFGLSSAGAPVCH